MCAPHPSAGPFVPLAETSTPRAGAGGGTPPPSALARVHPVPVPASPAAEAPGLPPLLRPPPAFLQGIIHFLSWKNIPTSFPFPFSSEFTQGHLQSPRFLCEEGPGGHEDRL